MRPGGRAGGARTTRIEGGARLRACTLRVAGDFSAAAFLLAAAAATPGAEITATGVSLNPTRTGLLDVFRQMGADLRLENERKEAGEPVGDVAVRGPEFLSAFDVPAEWVPRLVDEVPAWAVLASAARGTSSVRGAGELRVKESDRIVALARNLAAVGIEAHLDHRIVMAFAALGARTETPMTFDDVSSVNTSFPGFFPLLSALGAGVEECAT